MTSLGRLGTHTESVAFGISADGSTVLGRSYTSSTVGEAFAWTEANGMVGLGQIGTDGFSSIARRISTDGNVIIGNGRILGVGTEGFRMEVGGSMIGLGDLPGASHFSEMFDLNYDGSILVGAGRTSAGSIGTIWDAAHGLRSIDSYVTSELGIDHGGWFFGPAYGISDDGTRIVGVGANPQGIGESWMIIIPEPATSLMCMIGAVVILKRRLRS